MTDPKSLDEVLALLQADLPVLTKDKKGQVGNQKTKYADLVQVNAVVLSRLNAMGVIYKCKPTLRAEDPKFVLAYELLHVPSGTRDAGEYPLKLAENPMQMGSAITYARRYILLAMTGVVAEDEDDDGQVAAGQRYAQRANQRQRTAAPAEPAGETAQRAQRPRPTGQRPPLPGEQAPDGEGITAPQRAKLMAVFGQLQIEDRTERLATCTALVGRPLESANDLTKVETIALIDVLEQAVGADDPYAFLAEAKTTKAGAK